MEIIGPVWGIVGSVGNRVAACEKSGGDGVASDEAVVEGLSKGECGLVADGPVGADEVGDAAAEQGFGEGDFGGHAGFDGLGTGGGAAAAESPGFAGIEEHQVGETAKTGQVRAGKNVPVRADQSALGWVDGIEEGVAGDMDNIELAGVEVSENGAAAGLRSVSSGEAHRGLTGEKLLKSVPFDFGSGEIASGVDDEQDVEGGVAAALLEPLGDGEVVGHVASAEASFECRGVAMETESLPREA